MSSERGGIGIDQEGARACEHREDGALSGKRSCARANGQFRYDRVAGLAGQFSDNCPASVCVVVL